MDKRNQRERDKKKEAYELEKRRIEVSTARKKIATRNRLAEEEGKRLARKELNYETDSTEETLIIEGDSSRQEENTFEDVDPSTPLPDRDDKAKSPSMMYVKIPKIILERVRLDPSSASKNRQAGEMQQTHQLQKHPGWVAKRRVGQNKHIT